MGFYARLIFPRLCDIVMRRPDLSRLRRDLLSDVSGDVLEIGFGSGLNLSHYPERIRRITAVDPNPGMSAVAEKRVRASTIAVDYRGVSAERMPFPDQSFDVVVSTWTLCSIPDVEQALKEVDRLLRPGGRFFFLEHGRSDEAKIRKWQERLTPLNKRLADGCHLNRDIKAIIEGAGLKITGLKRFYMEGAPKILAAFYQGVATKPASG